MYAALAINIVALEESKPDPESSADYVDINPKADKTLLFTSINVPEGSSLPPFRMTTTSLHQTFVGLARRHTLVMSNHLARCLTSLVISCVSWNMLVLQQQSP